MKHDYKDLDGMMREVLGLIDNLRLHVVNCRDGIFPLNCDSNDADFLEALNKIRTLWLGEQK